MAYGICCIVLGFDEGFSFKFNKMTYAGFSKMERKAALEVLGSRILNNINVTFEAIKFCRARGYCYRLSSDLFPLVTYEKAGIAVCDLPQFNLIEDAFRSIREYLSSNPVRVSTHPDQFNVLATENEDSLARTVRELNFQSWVLDQLGCPADYNSPINIHVNNSKGSPQEIANRFKRGLELLDSNCRARLVVENEDKVSGWSVKKLLSHLNDETGCPITFDFLHHKCHPDGMTEEEALRACYETWTDYKPLFHYSESKDSANPRSHADYPLGSPETYGLDFDLDFEFKMKDRAVALFEERQLKTVA
jgi:UV DNA damage endonuclease